MRGIPKAGFRDVKGVFLMSESYILDRDRTGKCTVGECRDRVRVLEEELQSEMVGYDVEEPADYPDSEWASFRNEPPGFLGGHV